MADQTVRFESTSFVPPFDDSRWVFVDATVTGGILTILPGGVASIELEEEVNKDFAYMRVYNVFSGDDLSEENNYRNKPTVVFKELYKDSLNAPIHMIYRAIGFNTSVLHSPGIYRDETIFRTFNRPMRKMIVEIRNETEENLNIHGFFVFSSIDVAVSQVNQAIANITAGQLVETVRFRWDSGGNYLEGFDIKIPSEDAFLTHTFQYFSGRLTNINTNYAGSITVLNEFAGGSEEED